MTSIFMTWACLSVATADGNYQDPLSRNIPSCWEVTEAQVYGEPDPGAKGITLIILPDHVIPLEADFRRPVIVFPVKTVVARILKFAEHGVDARRVVSPGGIVVEIKARKGVGRLID